VPSLYIFSPISAIQRFMTDQRCTEIVHIHIRDANSVAYAAVYAGGLPRIAALLRRISAARSSDWKKILIYITF